MLLAVTLGLDDGTSAEEHEIPPVAIGLGDLHELETEELEARSLVLSGDTPDVRVQKRLERHVDARLHHAGNDLIGHLLDELLSRVGLLSRLHGEPREGRSGRMPLGRS